jgi:hypothetical protein
MRRIRQAGHACRGGPFVQDPTFWGRKSDVHTRLRDGSVSLTAQQPVLLEPRPIAARSRMLDMPRVAVEAGTDGSESASNAWCATRTTHLLGWA